jgi:hypothetical protein
VNRPTRPLDSATQQHPQPILKVIRSKCLDCSGGQPSEVRYCPVEACPLHPYRMGKNPLLGRGVDFSSHLKIPR